MRKQVLSLIAILLVFSSIFVSVRVQIAVSESATIVVPDDYPTISQAIAASNPGDTIFVKKGVYNESALAISKRLSIIGEERNTTVVDGQYGGAVFSISSDNVTLEGFTVKNGWSSNVYVGGASNVNISNNDIIGSYGRGVQINGADGCIIRENSFEECSMGISIEASSHITFSRNNIAYCESLFLYCSVSDNVKVYYNSIVGLNARIESSQILCDNGYPSGGNYWTDYSGTDANGDGIGDVPCHPDPLHPLIEDRYPLMTPFPCIHDVAVESLQIEPPIFNKGRIVPVYATLVNLGHFREVFNTTIYANSTVIDEIMNATLESEESEEIEKTWNTTSFAGGEYTIWAESQTVTGETNSSNNKFTYGIVSIIDIQILETIPCDQIGNPVVSFHQGETAYFKTTIGIMSYTASIVFSLNLYDEALQPIGLASFKGPAAPGNTTFILGIPIPEWAAVGSATAYSNIFTDWPHLGGLPLGFETLANFAITQNFEMMSSFSAARHVEQSTGDYPLSLDLGETPHGFNSNMSLTIFTNRISYIPTQTITISGELMYDGAPLRSQLAALEIVDPQGLTIVTRSLQTNDLGHFIAILSLPINAHTGNYTIYSTSAYYSEVAEDELAFELVTLTGDLNIDGKVNILDVVIVALAFGAKTGDRNWDARADVAAAYGIINILDLVVVAIHFGEHV